MNNCGEYQYLYDVSLLQYYLYLFLFNSIFLQCNIEHACLLRISVNFKMNAYNWKYEI